MDLLCRFGRRFPRLVARILDREMGKARKYREETITDILMAGLVPFEPLRILTDFPVDESTTGEDLDWEFVNLDPGATRRYLRLHIQAKRAHPYPYGTASPRSWWYSSLDHALSVKPVSGLGPRRKKAKPRKLYGLQHKRLVDHAASLGCCVPLFMFYHPGRSLLPSAPSLPDMEGVNWMFADVVPEKVTKSVWPPADKMVARWRAHLRPLHELLCFGSLPGPVRVHGPDFDRSAFLVPDGGSGPTPGELADRLRRIRLHDVGPDDPPRVGFEASVVIPDSTRALIDGRLEGLETGALPRPRAIFVSERPDRPWD